VTTTAGDREYLLGFSDRRETSSATGGLADARRIQNVLFGRPRAGEAGYGLNLQSYLMEIMDAKTLSELQAKASEQVSRYCPGVRVLAMVVEARTLEADPAGRGVNSLVVGFTLGTETGEESYALVATPRAGRVTVSTLTL
jgi:phage baseplate assembly protein W